MPTASCCGTGIEVFMCHGWSNGVGWLRFDQAFDPMAPKNILIGSAVTFWRIAHFHILHRSMHPWVKYHQMNLSWCNFFRERQWYQMLANFCIEMFTHFIIKVTIQLHSVVRICIQLKPEFKIVFFTGQKSNF